MKKRFKDAIRGTGGLARLASDETKRFAASIQPLGFGGDGHSGIGSGFLKNYKLFAEYNPITQELRDGDTIIFDSRAYVIKALEDWSLGGNPLYLSGILTLCEEAEA